MANAPANPADPRSPWQSHGKSKIVHPDGTVLAGAQHFEECLVAATIEVDDADRAYALRAANDGNVRYLQYRIQARKGRATRARQGHHLRYRLRPPRSDLA